MSLYDLLNKPEFIQQVEWTKEHYHKNEVIVAENAPGEDVFLILQGQLRVSTDLGSNVPVELSSAGLAKLESGDIFGELSIFDNEPRSAEVSAETECEIVRINGMKLMQYMEANPEDGYFIMRDLFANLVMTMRQSNLRAKTILQLYLNEQ